MRDKSREYFPLIEKFYSSGLTSKVFCNREGIGLTRLNYWKKRYRDSHGGRQAEKKGFASLSVVESKRERNITVYYSDGTRLVFEKAADMAMVKQFIPAFNR
jgi:hypothetical protein